MYNSPIEMLITDIQHQIVKQQDEEIYKAVVSYIPNIDKDELIRALQYDRGQYDKGYADGKADATPRWIPVTERLPDCADTVLAVDCDGIIASAYYVGNWHSGGELDEYAVTHWMPLPEPPKGE